MRNKIERTEIGSVSPFSFLKDEAEEPVAVNLDDTSIEDDPKPITEPPVVENNTPPVVEEEEPINTSSEEEEEEEENLPDTANVKIKTNIPKLLAERLKAEGQLPDDYEVTETTTAKDVENAYRKHLSDKIREEEKNEALQQLREEGYDETVLNTAKKLHYGVPEQEIQLEQAYTMLGSIEVDSSDENYEQIAKTLFEQYYLDKGLSPEEAKTNSNRDYADSGELDDLIQSRKNYFNGRAIELEEKHKESIKQGKLKEAKKKEDNIKKINKFLDGKVLDGVSYTEEEMQTVKKALFEKSEILVKEDGSRIRVTPYYKKKYERSRNEEKALKDIVDFVLGYDIADVANKSRKAARKKMVDDLNDLIEVDVEVNRPQGSPSTAQKAGHIERRPLN